MIRDPLDMWFGLGPQTIFFSEYSIDFVAHFFFGPSFLWWILESCVVAREHVVCPRNMFVGMDNGLCSVARDLVLWP